MDLMLVIIPLLAQRRGASVREIAEALRDNRSDPTRAAQRAVQRLDYKGMIEVAGRHDGAMVCYKFSKAWWRLQGYQPE